MKSALSNSKMVIKRKQQELMPKKVLETLGFVTIILALGIFLTGKTDIKSFFAHVTLWNFLLTMGQTIIAYVLFPTIVILSVFIIFDFPLLLFGLTFPITHFLWSILWWWKSSLSDNLFLSIVLIYLISRYQIEFKKFRISIFYISAPKGWYHGINVTAFFIKRLQDNAEYKNCLTIGLVIIEKINHK